MMFGIHTEFVNKYVVVASFDNGNFYLADAIKHGDLTTRKWTTARNNAIKFDSKSDARSIAALVCSDTVTYKICGISKKKQ